MYYEIQNKKYKLIILKKNNKNTYIRVSKEKEIIVTTSYLSSDKSILKLLDENQEKILKMLNKDVKSINKNNELFLLGKKYDIIIMPMINKVDIENNKIYAKDLQSLDSHLKKEVVKLFNDKYNMIYQLFEENIPKYDLKIRKMKTRWGVCNKQSRTITLNYNLIHYDVDCLEYVIVHELAHLVHFNHSREFWNLVFKYKKDYKKIKTKLKE